MFLDQQISTLEWFLKDHTEDWSNDAENAALHHRNKLPQREATLTCHKKIQLSDSLSNLDTQLSTQGRAPHHLQFLCYLFYFYDLIDPDKSIM